MSRKLGPDAFSFYVALGPERSHLAVARHFGVSKRTVTSTATRENWRERLADAEAKARKVTDEKAVDTLAEMNTRHLKVAKFLQSKGIETLKNTPISNAADAVRAIAIGLEKERLVRGEPTERTEAAIAEVIKKEVATLLEIVEDDEDDGEAPDQQAQAV